MSGLDRNWGPNLLTIEGKFGNAIFLPDGERLVLGPSWGASPLIQVRNAATGQVEQRLEGHSDTIYTMALSPDGSMLASGSADRTIRLWDMRTGKTRRSLSGHEKTIRNIAFSPCGKLLASGSDGSMNNLWLWNVESGRSIHRLNVSSAVLLVIFSPSGETLLAGSEDGNTWLWDVQNGKNEHTLQGDDCTGDGSWVKGDRRLAISPDGNNLAFKAGEKKIQLWDVAKWQPKHLLEGHLALITTVVFSPGNKLLSVSLDSRIRVWNVATGQTEHVLDCGGARVGIALSLDGRRLASFSINRTVRLWDTTTWELKYELPNQSQLINVAFSPDGERLASVMKESACLWDVTGKFGEYAFEGHSGYIWNMLFSSNGAKLMSSSDGTVRIWNATNGKTENILSIRDGSFKPALSPDGSTIASPLSSHSGTILVSDGTTSQIKYRLKGHDSAITQVVFSPDGQHLASGSYDGTIKIWEVTTGQLKHELESHQRRVYPVFSPDGRKLAAAAGSHEIWILEVATGQVEHRVDCGEVVPDDLRFSPDGSKVASTRHKNNVIWVWDIATGEAWNMTIDRHFSSTTTISEVYPEAMGPDMNRIGRHPLYALDIECRWVTRNGTKILYLPPDFRPRKGASTDVAVRDKTVAIANFSGRVTILQFAEAATSC